MFRFPLIASLLLGVALPSPAAAAITQTFNSRLAFVSATGHAIGLPINLPGVPTVFAEKLVTGPIKLTALDSLLAGNGANIISTAFDSDVLILDFDQPIFAIGLFGGVGDVDFGYIDGDLAVDAVGSGITAFTALSQPTYFGLISDTGFSQLRLSVRSFDEGASSVAFASLQDRIDLPSAVPEPTSWALLIAGFGVVGVAQRRRRSKPVRAAMLAPSFGEICLT
jgi:hypothetical protein